ncbi:Hsp70 family protein [Aspergillus mulundensis]|uniref:Heat shock 70 kDa protein 12A n=1 Tax=Aspergillus mulundensis TaxID=1810919 RepID=A0A3D8QRR5_9EURO|nr:Heat shock 70 kDa protein 12A [Aspergillus mulundensis]RDW64368.1 Heat shock 70 kDa protein 12A [Aspergillus mulundensis]
MLTKICNQPIVHITSEKMFKLEGSTPAGTTEPLFSFGKPVLKAQDSPFKGFGALSLGTKHDIIVGVDYGTTFTGASYVSSKATDISEIVVINSWPGPSQDTDTVFKTPSRIAYASDNPRLSKDQWGFQVEPGMASYSWTKLLLDQGTPLSQYNDSALEEASKIGIMKLPEKKDAVEVAGDYLAEVHQHILRVIGKSITEETLQVTPLEFWFTVPAIWSDRAKDATKKATRRAGFAGTLARRIDQIFLITGTRGRCDSGAEEMLEMACSCAIVAVGLWYGIPGAEEHLAHQLTWTNYAGHYDIPCQRDRAIEVRGAVHRNGFPTKETLTVSVGGKCGSTAVDRNFYRLMSERFGEAFDKLPMKRKGPGSEFMKKFETLKRDFGVSDEQASWELPLNMTVDAPDPKYFDEEERLVIIYSDDMRKIFDPVLDQIIQLVKRQIEDANKDAGRDAINRIILVGGFGDSEYLRNAFKSSFGLGGKIAITVPDLPQAAIVQGAALRGLDGIRSSTKRCRRHYGFTVGINFRPGIDDEANAYMDEYNDIKRGQKYAEEHTEYIKVQRNIYPGSRLVSNIPLYACDQDLAAVRVEHKGVYSVGKIVVDLSKVDLNLFESKIIRNERVRNVNYRVKITFGAQEGLLKFEAISRGQRIGETSIDFSTTKYY